MPFLKGTNPHIISTGNNNIVDLRVHSYLSFLRNVSTSEQSFECTITMTFEWYEHVGAEALSGWAPEVMFTNSMNDPKLQFERTLFEIMTDNKTKCSHTIVFTGRFAEHFELEQFPIDRQRLHIHVIIMNCPAVRSGHNQNLNEFNLVQGECTFFEDQFIDCDSWDVVGHFDYWRLQVDNFINPTEFHYLHKLVFHVTLQRKPTYYFWNIIFPISIQIMFSFCTAFMEADQLAAKTSITITIILTSFAVKFSCLQYIPIINCVTYLDIYLIGATMLACLVMGQNVVVFCEYSYSGHSTNLINSVSMSIMALAWVAANLLVYCMVFSMRVRHLMVGRSVAEAEPNDVVGVGNSSQLGAPARSAGSWFDVRAPATIAYSSLMASTYRHDIAE